ncbi:MAG: hypothetical protein ABUL68_04325, partial [Pseudomonadota bacterium]
ADAHEPTRVLGTDNELFPGFLSTYGLEGINGPDALMNPFYRELADATGLATPGDWYFSFPAPALAPRRKALDLLGVGYVIGLSSALPPESGCVKAADLDLHVYRRPGAWPRAFFTDRMATCDSAADFAALLAKGDGRPFAAGPAGPAGLPPLAAELAGRAVVPAAGYRLTNNSTRFVIDAPAPGLAVLTEAYLAGDFRATVDGQPVTYFRVNHAFKAVRIDRPGRHEIAFTYWPRHFTLSLALAAAGSVGFAALLFILLRPRGTPAVVP